MERLQWGHRFNAVEGTAGQRSPASVQISLQWGHRFNAVEGAPTLTCAADVGCDRGCEWSGHTGSHAVALDRAAPQSVVSCRLATASGPWGLWAHRCARNSGACKKMYRQGMFVAGTTLHDDGLAVRRR